MQTARSKSKLFVLIGLVLCALGLAAGLMVSRGPLDKPVAPPPFVAAVRAELTPPAVEPLEMIAVAPEDARTINAARPFSDQPIVPARPFLFKGDGESRARAMDCLAAAALYEAGDDAEGQRSVVQTVLNRARHPAYPHTVCGVVFQGSERSTGCQFTFTCDGALARTPSPAAWSRARTTADLALAGLVYAPVGLATHYHTDWVLPRWSASLDKISKIRTHLFFRFAGYWGTPGVMTQASGLSEPQIAALARLSPWHQAPGMPAPAIDAAAIATVEPLPIVPGKVATAAPGEGSVHLIALDPARFAGSYAMQALELCKGQYYCRVLGWRASAAVPQTLPLATADPGPLSFVYVRDQSRDIDRAWWNCDQTARSNPTQCLPEVKDEVRKILTPRH